MARKRGNGEGSIYRRKDGRWTGAAVVGYGEHGKPLRRSVYGRTRKAVSDKLRELQGDAEAGTLAEPTRLRVGEYLEAWLRDVVRMRVKPGTLEHYSGIARLHIARHIGRIPLRNLNPIHVNAMLSAMEKAEASPRLRQQAYVTARVAFSDAVRSGLLRRNPCESVSRPRAPRKEVRALDGKQVRALLKAAKGDPLGALYVLAIGTGLRQGELLGLAWRDVDLADRAVTIRRQVVESRRTGKRSFDEPKTSRSRRRVDLPQIAVEALRDHRRRVGAVPHPETLLFSDAKGAPLRKSNLHRRSWKPLLERAKLPPFPFHALRHTSATLALASGVHPKIVQERLGHASIAMTMDTYSHALPSMGREAAEQIDAAIRGRA